MEGYLLRAKISLSDLELSDTEHWLQLSKDLAVREDLSVYIERTQKELSQYALQKDQYLKLLEIIKPLSPSEQETVFADYFKELRKSFDDKELKIRVKH